MEIPKKIGQQTLIVEYKKVSYKAGTKMKEILEYKKHLRSRRIRAHQKTRKKKYKRGKEKSLEIF